MQVHLSTSSSEDVTDVLCVGLSYFFSLLSCFPSHKPLLILSAETVNFLSQWLSWPELLSAVHDWQQCCGAGAQPMAPVCSLWPCSKSSGWQQPCQHKGRAKTLWVDKGILFSEVRQFMSSAEVGTHNHRVQRDKNVQVGNCRERRVIW